MRVLLTGGSGRVGAFVAPALAAAGHEVLHLSRRPPAGGAWTRWDLGVVPPALPPAEALVHLAFDHSPNLYRGGEGDDPAGFLARNRDGSIALFEAARSAGVGRIVFLSSRAVYGDARRGETLRETDALTPDSLYGAMKRDVEAAVLARPGGVALRATGVYGLAPGARTHKWAQLFADYLAGRAILPRRATEVHGDDLAAAVALLLVAPGAEGACNASDILLDRHDLLAGVRARTGARHAPPPRQEGAPPGEMATDRLRALGWRPGGIARLEAFLDQLYGPPAPRRSRRGPGDPFAFPFGIDAEPPQISPRDLAVDKSRRACPARPCQRHAFGVTAGTPSARQPGQARRDCYVQRYPDPPRPSLAAKADGPRGAPLAPRKMRSGVTRALEGAERSPGSRIIVKDL